VDARAIVETFVDAFGEGRLDDALALLHDDFVIHAAGSVPYSGNYVGAQGFTELITKMVEVLELTPRADMQYLVAGDKVVLSYDLVG
jgi:ketosteroid isomerase-like protein